MFRKAKKHKTRKGAVWICDGHDYNSGVDASVVVDGSGHATTSYTRYTRYEENPSPQTNVLDAKHLDGKQDAEAGIDPTSEPSNTRKQVCHSVLFYSTVE
jgi:hypothetical protein